MSARPQDPEILLPKEVAAYLRISVRQVQNLAHRKVIPGVKIGSNWRFIRQEIVRFMQQTLAR